MTTVDQAWIAAAAVLFIGLVAALAGYRPLPQAGRRCRQCGYDLAGTPDSRHRCPECGNALAGGVVTGVRSESGVQWRRRFRRSGITLGVTALMLGLVALLFDARRLPWTPTWFMTIVDAPIASRLPDDRSRWSVAVFDTLAARADTGSSSPPAFARRLVDDLLPRLDAPARPTMGARRFILAAWSLGVVTDEELGAIDSIWPTPVLSSDAPPSVDGLDLMVETISPFDGVFPALDGTRSGRMRLIGGDWTATIGDEVVSTTRSRTSTNWPQKINPNASSRTGLLDRRVHPFDLEPGEVEVRVRRKYRIVENELDGASRRTIAEREIEFSGRFTIPEPAPLPSMVEDPDRLEAVAEAFAEASWARSEGPGIVSLHLATFAPAGLELATPRFSYFDPAADEDDRWVTIDVPMIVMTEPRLQPQLARQAMKQPIDDRLVHLFLTELAVIGGPAPDAAIEPGFVRVRLDTTTLDPRHWRALVEASIDEEVPDTLPAGIIEFEVPIVSGP